MKIYGRSLLIAFGLLALYLAPMVYIWTFVQHDRFILSSSVHSGALSVTDYGAMGDGITDDGAAFASAFADAAKNNTPIMIPGKTYKVNRKLLIKSGMIIRADGATITHTDSSIPILVAASADGWTIQGPLTLSGTRTQTGQHDAETGLIISGGTHFIVDKLTVKDFKGTGITIIDGKAARNAKGRGNHGQFAFVSFLNNTLGLEIDAGTGAEYNLFTLLSFFGNDVATNIASGNNIMTASNIVDNGNGIQLSEGINHGHGIFSADNINHNAGFNVNALNQSNGYTFNACHIYGDSETEGFVHLTQSAGIHISSGALDAHLINDDGSQNAISDDFIGNKFTVSGNNPAALARELLFDNSSKSR